MNKKFITEIEQGMVGFLNNEQMERLHNVLVSATLNKAIIENSEFIVNNQIDYLELFIAAKKVEGCSERSLKYYKTTLSKLISIIGKDIKQIVTNDLRKYLVDYETDNQPTKVTLDNIRRIISSFFSWLEDENYIIKSPARRIKKIKTGKTIKNTYSDEELEKLRDNCINLRDLTIMDLLSSTGMRIGELVRLNISDIDFEKRECVVLGKGNKERIVYFDARTKIHLQEYLFTRIDSNPALFVSLNKPNNRIGISGIEIRLRKLGKNLNIGRVYPHKFRRTLATKAIDKGMPIEQVQVLLGHTKIDTTLHYAIVNQKNVKFSHQKYLG